MRWIRVVANVAVILLAACLLMWVVEGLFGVDQSRSLVPMLGAGDDRFGVIVIGVALGLLTLFGAGDFVGRPTHNPFGSPIVPSARAGRLTHIGVGTIVEMRRTGTEINDVPQYELFFRVSPPSGPPFISAVRTLLDASEVVAVQPGSAFPIRFDPEDTDRVALADLAEPDVVAAMLQWRIDRGLLDPSLIAARRNGIVSPASVLAIRPTGRRIEGQVELSVRLLVTPRDGSSSWEADTVAFVMPEALSRVQVGSPVYAQYEPHDPMTVALRIEVGTETLR